MLLMRRAHRRELRRHIVLDDAVGMGYPAVGAFAGCDLESVARAVAASAASACQSGYSASECTDDETHLVDQALKTAKLVEHAVAPQEVVGGGRQVVAIGAEFQPLRPDNARFR